MNKNFQILVDLEHSSAELLPSYTELSLFRGHIKQNQQAPSQQPYQTFIKPTLWYRFIFLFISLVFFSFLTLIYSKSLYWTHTLFFQDSQLLKYFLYFFCGSLASFSLWIAYKIRPELEAIANIRKRAQTLLRNIYRAQMIKMGIHRFFPHQKQVVTTKHHFHTSLDHINHATEVARQLVLVISGTSMLSEDMRIKLFNQTILELQDKLTLILQQYQTAVCV